MYTGLPDELRSRVLERDARRCRWCGATNRGVDLHHIRYRRGRVDDVATNLISLCREHHRFVHGERSPAGWTIDKATAQEILFELVESPGVTGMALWRRKQTRG